jgi:hypothetical protein
MNSPDIEFKSLSVSCIKITYVDDILRLWRLMIDVNNTSQ